MTDTSVKEKQAFIEAQFKNLGVTSTFLLPIIAFLGFKAQDILPFLFGKESQFMVLPFQIIVWAVIFVYYSYVLLRIALFLNKKQTILLSLAVEALSAMVLNFSLIPGYGLVGLSIASVVTGILMFFFIIFSLAKDGIRIPLYKSYEKPVIATMGLTLVLHYVDSWPFPLILFCSIVGYCLILIITCALDK